MSPLLYEGVFSSTTGRSHSRPFTLLFCGRVALPGGVGWLGQRLTHKACRIYHCVFTEKVRQPLSGVHSGRLWAGLLPPVERHR